jgi:Mg-chelatase subunit ChlD
MIDNPNIGLAADDVAYSFTLYDQDNLPILERTGRADIPPGTEFPIFSGGVNAGEKIPHHATFRFTEMPTWYEIPEQPVKLTVQSQQITDLETTPRLSAILKNPSRFTLSNVGVVALLYDAAGNAVAASRTIVESLPGESSAPIFFTWRQPFAIQPTSCEQPVSVMLVTDRSGSMNNDNPTPPQPLTDTIAAARSFVNNLHTDDQVGLVSFATTAQVDQTLTANHEAVANSLATLTVLPEEEDGYTDLGDAVRLANEAFTTARYSQTERPQVMIILTDGKTNYPLPNGEGYAAKQIEQAKKDGIEVYVIGLGDATNEDFLRTIATNPDHYFAVLEASELARIYHEIGTTLCQAVPYVIEITPIVRYDSIR